MTPRPGGCAPPELTEVTRATAADFDADLPFPVAPEPALLSPRRLSRLDVALPSDLAVPDRPDCPVLLTGAVGWGVTARAVDSPHAPKPNTMSPVTSTMNLRRQ
jgi:hypothetical protein